MFFNAQVWSLSYYIFLFEVFYPRRKKIYQVRFDFARVGEVGTKRLWFFFGGTLYLTPE